MTNDPIKASVGPANRWADLGPRFITAVGMVVVSFAAVWFGNTTFLLFVVLCVTALVWELSRMCQVARPLLIALLSGAALLLMALLPSGYGLPFMMLPVVASVGRIGRERMAFAMFAVMILLSGFGLIQLRVEFQALWLVWLVLVVVMTDVAGYFAGRMLGGPKFWPKVSPKKTWSGTVAGWFGAAAVGLAYVLWAGAPLQVIPVSIALSMAAQMGDIAESALKRRVGVKDSSALLPGHGGFFDRLDGILGASIFLLMVEQFIAFPPVPV
ncbi:phosphatidate cytidylyltransferase [Pseudoruegeria sp. SK021]|uniref:phosphatidate cytidylyltransferase n=1 Tax=Pseudoruegeria sp. SK021 TaxID=1933035 RepID=UPI000A24EA1A|nr:phosphatidate cytidylyltransferase [Pseudoruegeria sp. SK021]OSP53641.1 phosphatidate cytidylyltransferase [Pseudoruegeria sp. SK021]